MVHKVLVRSENMDNRNLAKLFVAENYIQDIIILKNFA